MLNPLKGRIGRTGPVTKVSVRKIYCALQPFVALGIATEMFVDVHLGGKSTLSGTVTV
jgi:hypothetical protein